MTTLAVSVELCRRSVHSVDRRVLSSLRRLALRAPSDFALQEDLEVSRAQLRIAGNS